MEDVNGENGSLAEAAYASIRQAILRCDLAPGQQVTEAQLATRFGVGRAAVRAAMTRLAHERLVIASPRRGYEVAPVTLQHVRDLFGVRLIVEPAGAQLAASHGNDETIALLKRLNAACQHLPGNDDAPSLREANKQFHVAVARLSGNARLEQMTASVIDELDRVLYLPQLANVWDRIDSSFEEHQRVIEALKRRDAAGAGQAMREHVLPNQHFIIDSLISSPVLRSINLVGAT